MGKINWLDQEQWNIPADLGGSRGKQPAFKEESPAEPFLQMHIWVDFQNILGGASDSICTLTAKGYGLRFQQDYEEDLFFSIVGDTTPTVYSSYDIFSGAAPSDDGMLLRVGNFGINDGRLMKLYTENFYFVLNATGTAYTSGVARLAPTTWGI